MSHVSKQQLDQINFIKINKELYKVIRGLVNNGQTKIFLDQVLTGTEKMMIAKRLAIISMLDKGESSYSIEKMLKISSSTVARISRKYESGDFNKLVKELRLYESFLHQLQRIIPPRVGRNRFKNFLN